MRFSAIVLSGSMLFGADAGAQSLLSRHGEWRVVQYVIQDEEVLAAETGGNPDAFMLYGCWSKTKACKWLFEFDGHCDSGDELPVNLATRIGSISRPATCTTDESGSQLQFADVDVLIEAARIGGTLAMEVPASDHPGSQRYFFELEGASEAIRQVGLLMDRKP